jgi:hypothetical protein
MISAIFCREKRRAGNLVKKMATNLAEKNINTFLEYIPSLISEANRLMFCDNINVIEFKQRRT